MPEPSVAPSLPSWWLDEALAAETDPPPAPPLEGEQRADVAIIGGGYTGLWTALALKDLDPSLEVAVLESEVCGWGPSGRNGGFLHGYWTHLHRLRASLGDEDALTVARQSDQVIPAVQAFCDTCDSDVWFRVGGYLKVSTCPEQDAAVEHSIRVAAELGVPEEAKPLNADEIAAQCNSPRFRRGVFFRDGATVQPARLARTLRRVALERGIRIHERTRATKLSAGTPSTIETAGGRIQADEVIVATNAAETGWKPVSRKLTNFGSYVVLTEPIPGAPRRDRLDGRRGDHRRAHVHPLLPHHRRRAGRHGEWRRADRSRRPRRRPVRLRPRGRCARRGRPARTAPRARGREGRAGLGRAIDVSADQLPFFGTVDGTRVHYGVGYSAHGVGAELDGRADPRLARPAPRRRMERLAADSHAEGLASPGAIQASGRRGDPQGDALGRGRARGRTPPLARRAGDRRGSHPARNAARPALTHCATKSANSLLFAQHSGMLAPPIRPLLWLRDSQTGTPLARSVTVFPRGAVTAARRRSTGSTGS